MKRIAAGLGLAACLLQAQPWLDEIAAWRPPPGEARLSPQAPCISLRALTGFDLSVISAVLIPAGEGAAEFCRVQGLIQPRIRFEVALPAEWNGRLLMSGNGGYAGEDLENPGRVRIRNAAVRAGFLHTHTNAGHDAAGEPLGAFAMDPQKLADYAFRAVHLTAVSAKRIATAYYGAPPKRSYFMGCSTGGRQGLMAAQRFPEDFDGIYAGAPVLDFAGTMVNYVSIVQALARTPINLEKLTRAGEAIYAACDAKDGVKDGIIEDPRHCDFDPGGLPKCAPGAAPGCFTEGEIALLRQLYSDQFVGGKRVFPGWPVGIEAPGPSGRPGWINWLIRENGPPIFELFSEAFFRYLAFPKKDPNLRVSQVDLESAYPQLDSIRQMLNATDTNLSAFRDRGGKLLMWFGWADPALNPNMGVEYYEAVMREMGPGTADFFRLFMMPGVFHCAGGPGCDSAPRLAALIEWVERGQAPERIVASRVQDGKVIRTRPLCPYPQTARYKGSGSTDEAANFMCASPRPSAAGAGPAASPGTQISPCVENLFIYSGFGGRSAGLRHRPWVEEREGVM